MRVYFDNAATTPIDGRVVESMLPYLNTYFGNPSSSHSFGRKVKAELELSRKKIADILQVSPMQIFFTSSATEANNLLLQGLVKKNKIKHVISTNLEHHCVLNTLKNMEEEEMIQFHLLPYDEQGKIDLNEIENLLKKIKDTCLISLMHANNEVGNIYPIEEICHLAKKCNAVIHSDTVQTMGHYPIDVGKWGMDALVGTAHKFYGPKGVGFFYIKDANHCNAMIYGGSQERNMRGGTENIPGIIGMAKALELVSEERNENKKKILGLKKYFIEEIRKILPDVTFNGLSKNYEESLVSIVNINIPTKDDMLIFQLDLMGIAASQGSACSSGSSHSHVIENLNRNKKDYQPIRFSFGKQNEKKEIDYLINQIKNILSL